MADGLMFDKDEILQLTVEAYRPAAAAIPFGSARISIPNEGYTYQRETMSIWLHWEAMKISVPIRKKW